MGTTYKSPYAASFKSGIKRGTPPFVIVNNLASRKNVNPQKVWESLFKGGLVNRQKFNGQWLYWPVECGTNFNATNTKVCQFNMWQWFVDWCICNGCCTPEQLDNNKGSQKEFEAYFKKFWNKQFGPSTPSKGRKRTSTTRKPRTTASRKRGSSTTLKYRSKSKTGTRRYSNAA